MGPVPEVEVTEEEASGPCDMSWGNLSQESWSSTVACFRAKIMGCVNVLMCS